MIRFRVVVRSSRAIRRFAFLLFFSTLMASTFARAQTRVSDRDMAALMRNLRDDAKAFQPRFDDAVKKSAIRKTSQEKDAKKQVALLVKQTDDLMKRFKKDRSGTKAFSAVADTATQVDATVSSLSLGARATDSWQRVRVAVQQLATAYNMPSPFGVSASSATTPALPIPAMSVAPMGRQHTWLRISAFATAPLSGADVAVYDLKGKKIFERKDATNDRGVFTAHIPHLPRDFQVTAASDGGRQQDSSLRSIGRFTLTADVRDYGSESDIVYINPATTLAAHVTDKLQGHNLKRSEIMVRRYLALPPNASLGAAMRQGPYYQSPYFSETTFLAEARQHGGVDRFLNSLTPQALNPSVSPHPFIGARTSPVAVAKFIGVGLANGVLSWLGGQGIGWALSSGQKPEPGATKKDIEQLQEKLADLQSSVSDLSTQLKSLGDDLKAQLAMLQYTQFVVPAIDLSGRVNRVEENVAFYAQECPAIPEDADSAWRRRNSSADCPDDLAWVRSQLNETAIDASFDTFSGYMQPNGSGGSLGMVRLYSHALAMKVRFFRPADSTKMEQMFEYWYSAQIQSANLRTESLHLRNKQNTVTGRKELQDFLGYENADPPNPGKMRDTFAAEEKLMYPPVPVNTVVNTGDETMWLTDYPAPSKLYGSVIACGAPPDGAIWNHPVTEPVEIHGLKWLSPNLSQAKALVEGWTGDSANQWITKNSRAAAPDTPTSNGFFDLLRNYSWSCSNLSLGYRTSIVWTREFTGRVVKDSSNSYKLNYTLDINDGKIKELPVGNEGTGNKAWNLLSRELDQGEQYYWH